MSGFAIFIAVAGTIFIISRVTGKNTREIKESVFMQMAQDLGLNYEPNKNFFSYRPVLTGQIEGLPVRIFEDTRSNDDTTEYYMNIHFENTPYRFGFEIRKERFLNKMARKLGIKDIEFDNKPLDDVYRFKAHFEEEFRALITPKIQEELLRIQHQFNGELHNVKGKMEYKVHMNIAEVGSERALMIVLEFMLRLMKLRK